MTDSNHPEQSGAAEQPASQPGATEQPASQPGATEQPASQTAPAYGAAGAAPAYGSPPAYGQQAPGYGQPYGQPYSSKTNTLAIISLVASIAGIVILPFLGSLTGVICGHISLSQIKRTGEQGRGMAIAGLIVGYIGLVLAIVLTILVVAFSAWFFANYGTYMTY